MAAMDERWKLHAVGDFLGDRTFASSKVASDPTCSAE
jgi:hypothetical protein